MEEGYLDLGSPVASRGPSVSNVSVPAWLASPAPAPLERRSPTAPGADVERRLEELAKKYGLAERRLEAVRTGGTRPVSEVEELRMKLAEERAEVERLRTELGAASEQTNGRRSREADTQRELEAIRSELYAAKARAEQADLRRKALEEELEETKKHVAKVRGHVDRREERYLEQEGRLKDNESQLTQLRELTGRMQAECKARIERAEDERLRYESEAHVLRTKVRELKRQLKIQTDANRDLQRLWIDLRDIALAKGGAAPARGPSPAATKRPSRSPTRRESRSVPSPPPRRPSHEGRAAARRLDEAEFTWQLEKQRLDMEGLKLSLMEENRRLQEELAATRREMVERLYPPPQVERANSGRVIAKCRLCGDRFDVDENSAYACGYHPGRLLDGSFSCCGVRPMAGGPDTFCSFRRHAA